MRISFLCLALCGTLVGTLAAEEVSPRSIFTSTTTKSANIAETLAADSEPSTDCLGCVATCDEPACDGEACCESCCESLRDCDCRPCWTFRGGAIFLQRSTPASGVIATDLNDNPLMNLNGFQFNSQAGFDVGAIRSIGQGRALEVRYFQIDGSNESQVNYQNTSFVNVQQYLHAWALLTNAANHPLQVDYQSALRSAEINLLGQSKGWLSPLVGFRYLNLNETLNISQSSAPFNILIEHRFVTRNDLFGGQLGFNAHLWTRGRLRVDSWLKAGLYANDSSSEFRQRAQFLSVLIEEGRSRAQTAFVGDLGFTGAYQLTNHLAVRGGYQLLWIDGVTLASDQLNIGNANGSLAIKSNGSVFYHGALVGLELTW